MESKICSQTEKIDQSLSKLYLSFISPEVSKCKRLELKEDNTNMHDVTKVWNDEGNEKHQPTFHVVKSQRQFAELLCKKKQKSK